MLISQLWSVEIVIQLEYILKRSEFKKPTCGVNAKIRSCNEYNLLVLKMPTSRERRPESVSFLFWPIDKKKIRFSHILKNQPRHSNSKTTAT